MRIGELARKSGFRASAIRFYERVGVLPPALRHNGQRRYGANAELHLSVIAFARKAGFTLEDIRSLFHGFDGATPPSRRWRKLSRNRIDEIETLIAQLRGMEKLLKGCSRCRCVKLEDCGRMLRSGRRSASTPPNAHAQAQAQPRAHAQAQAQARAQVREPDRRS
jgi:MerR family transcriptional regulator, redox-sensitive transcriptional activator SoxR